MLPTPLDARAVKREADIVAIAGRYTNLKRSCRQFVGLCPTADHHERHASFYVHPRGVWYCFGCHRGGDVFRLIQLIEGCSFPRALEIVADSPMRAAEPPKAARSGRRSRPAVIARKPEPRPRAVGELPLPECAVERAWLADARAARERLLLEKTG
jgi:CHC2 zinc finger